MKPELKVTIGKQVHRDDTRTSNNQNQGYKELEMEFESAKDLYEKISKQLDKIWHFKVNLGKFRSGEDYQPLFWNLIYYFNEYHLPYEFILPYEDK